MPYITLRDRAYLDVCQPDTPGMLNYKLTMICKDYLEHNGESYQVYNDIIGALECCKLELYRRKTTKYEDEKLKENGDVW